MRKLVLALFLTIIGVSGLQAQATGLPVCPYGTVDQNMMVELVRTNRVQARCHITEEQMRRDLNSQLAVGSRGTMTIRSREEHAEFIRGLERVNCMNAVGTAGGFDLSWVTNTNPKRIASTVFHRSCRANEVLLCNRNLNLCTHSENCWNGLRSEVTFEPRPGPLVAAPVQPSQPLGPRRQVLVDTTRIQVDVNLHDQRQPVAEERRRPFIVVRRDWPWMALAAGLIGGGVYCGVVSDTHCGMVQEVVIIHN